MSSSSRPDGLLAVVLVVAAWLGGCDNRSSPTAPATPEAPDVPILTDAISGSFGPGETSCHDVDVTQSGDLRMTLVSLDPSLIETTDPPFPLRVGVGIGRPAADSTCTLFAQDPSVNPGDVLLSERLDQGAYCVCVFDPGNVPTDTVVSYEAQVDHP